MKIKAVIFSPLLFTDALRNGRSVVKCGLVGRNAAWVVYTVGPGSSVGITTDYGLDGIESR